MVLKQCPGLIQHTTSFMFRAKELFQDSPGGGLKGAKAF